MNDSQTRYVVHFHGQVQGVGFRANALSQSRGLRVRGFVRNRPDGSVELDVVGAESELRELLKRIDESMKGNIDDTVIETLPAEERADEFRIRYS
ncbi:Acylphosphatase domain protein [Rhodopirellula maiorica SM1]|uniref:acylphosphatase n=1 Tax=Rhodopirellula maiorica SM1 TaxID=1265738 RepID=M5RK02_9BACT|nr:acylphosphatase [Rhodopirellula maiorica]EMI19526.1 Acylphosphatase domain protein [Rhodopirellula maiorica SM1]